MYQPGDSADYTNTVNPFNDNPSGRVTVVCVEGKFGASPCTACATTLRARSSTWWKEN